MQIRELKTLGELIEIKHGFAFSGEHIVSDEQDRILITPGHFEIGGGFRHNHKKFFNSYNYRDGYELEPGELIVTMTDLSNSGDTLGYAAVVPNISGKILLHNQRVGKVILKTKEIDIGFCHYLLRSAPYRHHVLATCTGSTVKHTSPSKILDYKFSLPPIAEQKAIAHILGALDDKIENNRRMNETLEEMARAVFKSWFVDFDPVRAKMEGRPTRFPDDISDLFPNELVDSEIGQIPKGWKVSKIKDQCERLKVEKRYSNKIVQPTGIIPVLDQTTSTIIGFHSEPTFISASFEEPVVTFANHTCNIRLLFNNFSVIQNVIPLRPVKLPTLWFYLRILGVQKFEEYKGHIIDFMDKNLCFPSFESANALEQIVEPIFYKIESNTSESKTLAELRDTLLPKLISGEIRVKDAERKMETAI